MEAGLRSIPQTRTTYKGRTTMTDENRPVRRFLKLSELQDILNISSAQAYALVRSGELPAIQIGGRGHWRVEARVLEEYIAESYRRTKEMIARGLPEEALSDE